jgi:hypothetical protein
MALVDPGDDRHQLDGSDAELVQVIDDRRMGECTDRAAHFGRYVGVAHREAADIRLVDQPTWREERRTLRDRRRRLGDDRLGH